MKNIINIQTAIIMLLIFSMEVNSCMPSGRIRAKKHPPNYCNLVGDDICCIQGRIYTTYNCSPPSITHNSGSYNALLTLNTFEGGGYGPSQCDHHYHSDKLLVVALSSGWFDHGNRCLTNITINNEANGRSVKAMVVNECDSTSGCDKESSYLPPCGNNIVDASEAVWRALEIPINDWGELNVTWSDA
ncbi:putative ripening-related protein 1 [Impatiens glandulifera]|uniref:putative ripening-related protein 1 n=1 Tax=Impatiens glandulifera TaxID=253017 RepID=UPI001FB18307|nr:putative ripening-related protein 1 [Impatiens glandulifera]